MSAIRVSLAQYAASLDVEANTKTATDLIAAAGADSDLVVLPENAMYSDPTKQRPGENHHETLEGPFVSALAGAAKDASVDVIAGFTETSDDERSYNTLVHVTAAGTVAGVYRKIHLYDAFGYRESDKVRPAEIDEPYVFTIKGVKVGALTCYDLRFPEISRWVADQDADLIVLPAAWAVGPAKEMHWETLARARAIENTIYFAACGQTGPHCTGQSFIADPMGVVIASAGEAGNAIATGVVDTDRVQAVRKTNPSLANRRFTVTPSR